MKRLFPFILLSGIAGTWPKFGQPESAKDVLPPTSPGKEWKLIWHDEFDSTTLDQTKWTAMGDWKRRDGFWVKEDAYLSGKGTLLLRTKKDGDRYTCGAIRTLGKVLGSGDDPQLRR